MIFAGKGGSPYGGGGQSQSDPFDQLSKALGTMAPPAQPQQNLAEWWNYRGPQTPYEVNLLKKNPQLKQQSKPQTGPTGSNAPQSPLPPGPLQNTTQLNPKLENIYQQSQTAMQTPNPKVEQLWQQYQDRMGTSNLDQLQDVMGSKIRDRYEGARSQNLEDMARRGLVGSGVEQERLGKMGDQEMRDLVASDTNLALADQGRMDALVMGGMPMATYNDQRVQQLMATGMTAAQAQAQIANQDKALGLQQWTTQIGAQLQRDEFGLQRDIAAQNAQQAQQNMLLNALQSLAPLFGLVLMLWNVFPGLAFGNEMNGSVPHSVASGYGQLRDSLRDQRADFTYLGLSQLDHAMPFATIVIQAKSARVGRLFKDGGVFEVGDPIVSLYAVDVIDGLSWWLRSDECVRHQIGNWAQTQQTILQESDSVIPIGRRDEFFETPSLEVGVSVNCRLGVYAPAHAADAGDFISLPAIDDAPLFDFGDNVVSHSILLGDPVVRGAVSVQSADRSSYFSTGREGNG